MVFLHIDNDYLLVEFEVRWMMGVFVCTHCGCEKEGRCKPQKCPRCGSTKSFEKKEGNKQTEGGVKG